VHTYLWQDKRTGCGADVARLPPVPGCRQVNAVDDLSQLRTGQLTRERRVEASARTDIEASPAVVYSWVTAPDRVVSWVKDLVESRPLADGAALQVGARSIEVLRVGRTLLEVPAEVTALQPDRLIENRLETPGGLSTSRAHYRDRDRVYGHTGDGNGLCGNAHCTFVDPHQAPRPTAQRGPSPIEEARRKRLRLASECRTRIASP
jgi:uncharacterized protein YndB with AHSA1/START domain